MSNLLTVHKAPEFKSMDKRYGKRNINPLRDLKSRTSKPLGLLAEATLSKYFRMPKDNGNHITMRARLDGDRPSFYCSSCREWHTKSLELYQELPVLVGDSQAVLHGSMVGRFEGDQVHYDYLASGGYTIMECLALTVYYYWPLGIPLKLVLLAGTNDLLAGRKSSNLLEAYKAFRLVIEEFDEASGLAKGSSNLVISTLLLPPRLYLRNNEQLNTKVPYFTQAGKEIHDLNKKIVELNMSWGNNGSVVPFLEPLGRRSSVKEGVRIYSNQPTYWREGRFEDQLHISNRFRSTILNKLLRTLNIITSSSNLITLPQVTKEERLRSRTRNMEYGMRASKAQRKEPTDRNSVSKGKFPEAKPQANIEEQSDPMSGGKPGTTEENQPTDRYSVNLDDFVVQDELDHEGNEEEQWETRTVRFVEDAKGVNNNDTKRKRRPWKEVAVEARGNLKRTEETLKKKDNNGNEGYAWLSDDSGEFNVRYGEVSSDEENTI